MAVIKFLDTQQTKCEVKKMLQSASAARLAVSYWGNGASKQLGLDQFGPSKLQIICDLFSGVCNPDELRALVKGGALIRCVDGLHSKVYLTKARAVVGSSNASANGLAFEGAELQANAEASVLSSDTAAVQTIHKWFETLWDIARPVNLQMIESVRPLWNKKRSSAHRQYLDSLLTALQSEMDRLSALPIRVLFYDDEGPREEAIVSFASSGQARYEEADLTQYHADNELPYYDVVTDWPVRPETIYLDFTKRSGKRQARFHGIWQVRKSGWQIPAPSADWPDGRIILLNKLLDIDGLRFPKTEQSVFCDLVVDWMKRNNPNWSPDKHDCLFDVPLSDFWQSVSGSTRPIASDPYV
jgi:hypothetical protein